MKRGLRWNDDLDDSSDEESSSRHSDSECSEDGKGKSKAAKRSSHDKPSSGKNSLQAKSGKKKGIDFEALKQHGYKGGLSVLKVPQPKEQENWSWSNGKATSDKQTKESYADRQETRVKVADAEILMASAVAQNEKKNASFSQKEKRKRDLGQASRGKNYVEEEKRMLRDSGVYSGFDT